MRICTLSSSLSLVTLFFSALNISQHFSKLHNLNSNLIQIQCKSNTHHSKASELILRKGRTMENNSSSSNSQQGQPSPFPPQAPFHHLLQQQQQQLQMFWTYQRQEIEQVNDFKNHQLPLARIKKIMKADEDVRMISAEAPILFAKACELFILELTIRSWLHAEENKRRTLQKNDIAAAVTRTDIFDFLVDIVPREEMKEEAGLGLMGGATASGVPYYYPPVGQTVPGVMMGRPAMPGMDPNMYVHQPSQAWQSVWQSDEGPYGNIGGTTGQAANLDKQGYVDQQTSDS